MYLKRHTSFADVRRQRYKNMEAEKKRTNTESMTYSRYGSPTANRSSGAGSQSKKEPSKKGAGTYRYSSMEDR